MGEGGGAAIDTIIIDYIHVCNSSVKLEFNQLAI